MLRTGAVFVSLTLALVAGAQQQTAHAVLEGKSIQLLPSAPSTVVDFGEVVTRFSSFNGKGGMPLIDSAHGDLMSGEMKPVSTTPGLYQGSYGQTADSVFWDYGSYAIAFPVADTDGNGMPDVIQFGYPGTFTATGSGDSGPSGLTFTLNVTFTRAANSANGTYLATAHTSEGLWNLVSGPYVLLSYQGSVSYTRGATNTLDLSLTGAFAADKIITGSTTFSTTNADSIVLAAFDAHDGEGNTYPVNATTLIRKGSHYQGTLSLDDGLADTYWADFTDYALTFTDTNDSNDNGVPDLSDGNPSQSALTLLPQSQTVNSGGQAALAATLSSGSASTLRWLRNGSKVADSTTASLSVSNVQPANAGIYSVVATIGSGSLTSGPALVGFAATGKVTGSGTEVGVDVVHPNGNIFDQILLTGTAEAITADAGQVTRTSFIDLDDDIVQVEFSGAGTLSLVLDTAEAPATPAKYHQPTVAYVKGHAGIIIAGADETTNVSVFTVGRATAFDPTGVYDITKPISATNDPAKNGSPLFQGQASTVYDGAADIAFIAISSTNGKFGGVRTSNANYFASKGLTGIYAPGVTFTGPLFIGNVTAFDAAMPVILIGSVSDARVTGGDMFQSNGQYVRVSGMTRLKFTEGTDSNGSLLPAQLNRALYKQSGTDVTARLLANPL